MKFYEYCEQYCDNKLGTIIPMELSNDYVVIFIYDMHYTYEVFSFRCDIEGTDDEPYFTNVKRVTHQLSINKIVHGIKTNKEVLDYVRADATRRLYKYMF